MNFVDMGSLARTFDAVKWHNTEIQKLNSDPSRPDYSKKVEEIKAETLRRIQEAVQYSLGK